VDRSAGDDAVAATVRDEGDKGCVSDGLETDDQGRLYVTANQLYRQDKYRGGEDQRRTPYALFRTPIDAGPVRLR
jgi:sugar lactone lactonase YvrE